MKKKYPDRYVYPAVFTYEPGQEIAVVFPDLGCATSGIDDKDALFSARELLGGRLALLEEDGADIPVPSPLSQVILEEKEHSVLVDVYMPAVRLAGVTKSVNRTVTLSVEENSVSFSDSESDRNLSSIPVQSVLPCGSEALY